VLLRSIEIGDQIAGEIYLTIARAAELILNRLSSLLPDEMQDHQCHHNDGLVLVRETLNLDMTQNVRDLERASVVSIIDIENALDSVTMVRITPLRDHTVDELQVIEIEDMMVTELIDIRDQSLVEVLERNTRLLDLQDGTQGRGQDQSRSNKQGLRLGI